MNKWDYLFLLKMLLILDFFQLVCLMALNYGDRVNLPAMSNIIVPRFYQSFNFNPVIDLIIPLPPDCSRYRFFPADTALISLKRQVLWIDFFSLLQNLSF